MGHLIFCVFALCEFLEKKWMKSWLKMKTHFIDLKGFTFHHFDIF